MAGSKVPFQIEAHGVIVRGRQKRTAIWTESFTQRVKAKTG
jgi:hypothetical protein